MCCQISYHKDCASLLYSYSIWESLFSHSLQEDALSYFQIFAHLIGKKWHFYNLYFSNCVWTFKKTVYLRVILIFLCVCQNVYPGLFIFLFGNGNLIPYSSLLRVLFILGALAFCVIYCKYFLPIYQSSVLLFVIVQVVFFNFQVVKVINVLFYLNFEK